MNSLKQKNRLIRKKKLRDAEAAVAMFSAAINGKIAQRLMSTDNNYKNNVVKSNKYSRFCEEIDDWSDLERENVVKIAVL